MITKLISVFLFLMAGTVLAQNEANSNVNVGTHYPRLMHADVPLYPPVAATVRFGGTVEIQVVVKEGNVVDAQILRGKIESMVGSEKVFTPAEEVKLLPYLSEYSLANLKSWRFQQEEYAVFTVTYEYRIEGDESLIPENPKVVLDLPHSVRITTRPCKPTTN